MPFITLAVDRPWCNGRIYANADGRTKTWCERRPPPHWWIVELAGFVAPFEHLNADHILPIYRVATGRDPMVIWERQIPAAPPHLLQLSWLQDFEPGPRRYYIVVAIDIFRNLLQATSWRSPGFEPITTWMSIDSQPLTEQVRSPLWQAGDVTCKIKVGTYDRLPAGSCRGDWAGEFPPP